MVRRFIHIGFENFIDRNRITKITKKVHNQTQIESLEMIKEAGLFITMTSGRTASSIIQMDSGHFILSYLTPEELQERLAV